MELAPRRPIAVVLSSKDPNIHYVYCDDGTVWKHAPSSSPDNVWQKLPVALPQSVGARVGTTTSTTRAAEESPSSLTQSILFMATP
jgi:hypothetical protein